MPARDGARPASTGPRTAAAMRSSCSSVAYSSSAPWIGSTGQSTSAASGSRFQARNAGPATRRTSRGRPPRGRREGGHPLAQAAALELVAGRADASHRHVLHEHVRRHQHEALDRVASGGVDERDRGAVAVAHQQRLLDAQPVEQRAAPRAPPRGRRPACAGAAAGRSARGQSASRRSRGGRSPPPAPRGSRATARRSRAPRAGGRAGVRARRPAIARPRSRGRRRSRRGTVPAVRVVTWNVAGRVGRQPSRPRSSAARSRRLALQEVTPRTLPCGGRRSAAGLRRAEHAARRRRAGAALLGVLTAARERFERLAAPPGCRGPSGAVLRGSTASRSSTCTRRSRRARAGQGAHPRGRRRRTSRRRPRRGSCAATSTRRAASCPTATC